MKNNSSESQYHLASSFYSFSSYVTLFTNIPKERAKFKLSRQVPSSIPFVVFDRKYKLQKFLYFFLPLVGLSQAITNGPNEVFQATNLSLLQIFLRTLLEFGDKKVAYYFRDEWDKAVTKFVKMVSLNILNLSRGRPPRNSEKGAVRCCRRSMLGYNSGASLTFT